MFNQILQIIQDYLGYYDSPQGEKLAISQSYAIDNDVYGLECIVSNSDSTNLGYSGSARTSQYCTTVMLTQHDGRNTIDSAVQDLSNVSGWNTKVKWVLTGGKQQNVRRALVIIENICIS